MNHVGSVPVQVCWQVDFITLVRLTEEGFKWKELVLWQSIWVILWLPKGAGIGWCCLTFVIVHLIRVHIICIGWMGEGLPMAPVYIVPVKDGVPHNIGGVELTILEKDMHRVPVFNAREGYIELTMAEDWVSEVYSNLVIGGSL